MMPPLLTNRSQQGFPAREPFPSRRFLSGQGGAAAQEGRCVPLRCANAVAQAGGRPTTADGSDG